MIRSIVDREENGWTHGHREQYCGNEWVVLPNSNWVKSPPMEFPAKPEEILKSENVTIDWKRVEEFKNFSDGSYEVYYYLGVASRGVGDHAFKWILSALATELNVRKLSSREIQSVLPATVLNQFCKKILDGSLDKTFAKPIFAELLLGKELDRLLIDPRFQAMASNALEDMIDKLIQDNPDQFAKAKENPKLIQWFVGQAMKATGGKSNPNEVRSIVEQRLGDDQ